MKLTQSNAYSRSMMGPAPLDSYESGNKNFVFFLIRFWSILSSLCS